MKIYTNEFETIQECIAAIQEFPFCGTCRRSVKIQQINGRNFVHCIDRPHAHHGISSEQIGA